MNYKNIIGNNEKNKVFKIAMNSKGKKTERPGDFISKINTGHTTNEMKITILPHDLPH